MPLPEQQTPQNQLKQIQAAWEEAQAQVEDLHKQVEYLANLAQAKTTNNLIQRDVDRAFRDLGEAVWAQVSKGKLQLPASFSSVMKSLEAVTRRIQEQNASINDLFAEGAEIAARLKSKVATGAKKR